MPEKHLQTDKMLIRVSRAVSMAFTPFSFPLVAYVVLFVFSYLRIMPLAYKMIVLGMACCFTILLPALAICLFRRIMGYTREEMGERKHRYVPFALTILSYVSGLVSMHRLNIPWYMTGILLAALLILATFLVVNIRWKLSEHMAGAGGIVGGLVAFSALFGYNPVWWLCLSILIAGILGTARLILSHHTPGEVLGGFIVGLVCALLVLHPASNIHFRYLLF